MTTIHDVGHLGPLVGAPHADRIVALSTSAVFRDKSLLRTFMHSAGKDIDSGFQGHLYTRPNDIFMVRVPDITDSTADRIGTAIHLNHEIWASLLGIELASSSSRIVLATDDARDAPTLPQNMAWHAGSLLDAAAARYLAGGASFLAFVLDESVATKLGIDDRTAPELIGRARAGTCLMDKNRAMKWLRDNGIDIAPTWTVDHDMLADEVLGYLPDNARYVFKPAGGAAGAGVFPGGERGADAPTVRDHVSDLRRRSILPQRFQIQEFLSGALLGASARIGEGGSFDLFEVHRQRIDTAGRFVGAWWSRAEHPAWSAEVEPIFQKLAGIDGQVLPVPLCLDVIGGRIIEVNPRVTAAAPIAHLLRREEHLSRWLDGRRIDRIDLSTQVQIPYEAVRSGWVRDVVAEIRRYFGVLVLPQGLNPFGNSRVAFVNDDADGSAQRMFADRVRW